MVALTSRASLAAVSSVSLLALLVLVLGGCRHGRQEPEAAWRIVFTSDRGGEFALWSVRPDGGGLVRIAATNTIPTGEPPLVAPDWTKLLLPRQNEVVVVDASGRRLLAAGDATTASWSPSGERVAFRGRRPGLSLLDADGENERRLTESDDDEPVWSPQGDRIAFLRWNIGVGVVEADGSGERILWRGDAHSVSWGKGGHTLSFLDYTDSESAGERVTIDAERGLVLKRTRAVEAGADNARVPSPDGRQVAVERPAERNGRSEIVVMNTDGSNPRRVSGPREHAHDPVWAPDGRSLIYIRTGVDGSQLWTVRSDGAGRRPVTRGLPGGGNVYWPGWARIPFTHQPSPFRARARRTKSGSELELPFPVVALGASGGTVAIASPVRVYAPSWILTPPLIVWDAVGDDVSRLNMRNCDVPDSIVLVGGEIAFDCRWIPHAVAYFGGSVYVSLDERRRAVALNPGVVDAEGGKPGRLPGRVAGGTGAVVFAVDAFGRDAEYAGSTLWRVRDRRSERIAADVGEPVAVDRGRVVTEHPNGRVAVLDLDGRVIRVFAPGGRGETPPVYGARRLPTVGLSGPDLVVLRGRRLAWYDAASGRLRGTVGVKEGAVFAGVARGLTAYVNGTDIHAIRLRGGAEAVIRAPGRSVKARLTDAGLFYAFHRRAVRHRTILRHERNPARVVFLRRAFVERQLR